MLFVADRQPVGEERNIDIRLPDEQRLHPSAFLQRLSLRSSQQVHLSPPGRGTAGGTITSRSNLIETGSSPRQKWGGNFDAAMAVFVSSINLLSRILHVLERCEHL